MIHLLCDLAPHLALVGAGFMTGWVGGRRQLNRVLEAAATPPEEPTP